MTLSDEQVLKWIGQGVKDGAVELLVGLDVWVLTPSGLTPEDQDYYPVYVMPNQSRSQLLNEKIENVNFCFFHGSYRIPSKSELDKELSLDSLRTQGAGRSPSYLVNVALYRR